MSGHETVLLCFVVTAPENDGDCIAFSLFLAFYNNSPDLLSYIGEVPQVRHGGGLRKL